MFLMTIILNLLINIVNIMDKKDLNLPEIKEENENQNINNFLDSKINNDKNSSTKQFNSYEKKKIIFKKRRF